MSNKAGSEGQTRKTTAQWAVDTKTYLEGERLMDTDTGVVRVSKGTTYALAWLPDSAGGVSQVYVDAADANLQSQINDLDTNLSGKASQAEVTSLSETVDELGEDIEAVDLARVADKSEVQQQIVDEANARAAAITAAVPYLSYEALISQTGTGAPTVVVKMNQLGGTVVWTRDDVGRYIGTLAGAFPTGRITCHASQRPGSIVSLLPEVDAPDAVRLETYSPGSLDLADDLLSSNTILIKQYPS